MKLEQGFCMISAYCKRCIRFLFYYRPPTKLGEGNVLTRVCLSVHRGRRGAMWPLPVIHWTSLYRPSPWPRPCSSTWDLTVRGCLWTLGLTVQGPLTSDIWWTSLETCSNLFTSGHLPLPVLTSDGYRSTYSCFKWMVCILLVLDTYFASYFICISQNEQIFLNLYTCDLR